MMIMNLIMIMIMMMMMMMIIYLSKATGQNAWCESRQR